MRCEGEEKEDKWERREERKRVREKEKGKGRRLE